MRVYELAKKLGMENRVLIPELQRMGIHVTSHSSALDKADAQRVMETLAGKSLPEAGQGQATAKRSGSKEAAGRKKAAAARESKGREGVKSAASVGIEEPQKSEKKRILIKRKKLEEEEAATTAASPVEESVAETPRVKQPTPPAQPWPPETAPEEPPREAAAEMPQIEEVEGVQAAHAPTAEAKPSEAAAAAAGPEETATVQPEPKPAEKPVEETGREKQKKVRKPGRTEEEEAFKYKHEDAARWRDLRALPVLRREERARHHQPSTPTEVTKPRKKIIKLTPGMTVKEFAELVGQRSNDLVRKLMEMGLMLTVNQPMNLEAGVLIAENLGLKAEIVEEKQGEALLEELSEGVEEAHVASRAPVVTMLGHVDHGKTSLLDAIREAKVTEQEFGGITQHIGAYTVKIHGKQVTFLDTPGHEAFTAMRARGAKITDIVILVVAADDGVMPQTVEAINHAKAANVPIIVAINKIDRPDANPDRVRQVLSDHDLVPEAWGGQTIFVEVSAKQKLGLDSLLEMILLQAEVMELTAGADRSAKGVVLEAKLDRGRGPVATVLVQNGTLRLGDVFVVGTFSGRVRAMASDAGKRISEAGPSIPVEVVGLPGVPAAGDLFIAVKDEKVAREIAQDRMQKQRTAELAAAGPRMTLDDLYSKIKEGEVKELPLVIKADAQGSAEALGEALEKLSTPAVKLRVIHKGVGGITETDVLLASASGAIVIGFNIRPEPKASALAEREGVDIRLYSIIYNAIEDIKAAMEGMLEPTVSERVLGRAEVRQLFTVPKVGVIAGCYVLQGTISRTSTGARVLRDNVLVYEGKVESLRRFKDDVRDVQQGYECGIGIQNFNDLKVGDIIEAYVHEKVAAKL